MIFEFGDYGDLTIRDTRTDRNRKSALVSFTGLDGCLNHMLQAVIFQNSSARRSKAIPLEPFIKIVAFLIGLALIALIASSTV